MNKKQLFRHLDQSDYLPDDPEQRELATLLAQVGAQEVPDPGDIYWQRFNQRLRNKLDSLPQGQKGLRWLRGGIWGALAAAAALVLFIWSGAQHSEKSPALEHLSDEGLETLRAVFCVQDDGIEDPFDLEDPEMEVLLQAYGSDYETLLFELEGDIEENMQDLKSYWDVEG